jgi:hypothetical protein
LVATFVATIFVPLFFTLFARRNQIGQDEAAVTGQPQEAAGE